MKEIRYSFTDNHGIPTFGVTNCANESAYVEAIEVIKSNGYKIEGIITTNDNEEMKMYPGTGWTGIYYHAYDQNYRSVSLPDNVHYEGNVNLPIGIPPEEEVEAIDEEVKDEPRKKEKPKKKPSFYEDMESKISTHISSMLHKKEPDYGYYIKPSIDFNDVSWKSSESLNKPKLRYDDSPRGYGKENPNNQEYEREQFLHKINKMKQRS